LLGAYCDYFKIYFVNNRNQSNAIKMQHRLTRETGVRPTFLCHGMFGRYFTAKDLGFNTGIFLESK
jgi:hypothetical protein